MNKTKSGWHWVARIIGWTMAALLAVGAVLAAIGLLRSAWFAFTWYKFKLLDYGVYTNMIWNCGHGDLFRTVLNNSYLSTHLSFTLALLGPLFRLFDHPFFLSAVQWLFVVVGTAILVVVGVRRRVPVEGIAAVAFFTIAGRLTQAMVLSEFHGVSAYYLLVPWLYYCLTLRKSMAWLPLVLILGVREEACLLVLPMILYFSIRDRWRGGFILAGVALAYGALAIFWLYPLINGFSLFQRRSGTVSVSVFGDLLHASKWTFRRLGLLRAVTPMLVFIGARLLPVVVIPLVGVLSAVLTGYGTQQALGSHYGGPVAICLAVGMMEALAQWSAQLQARGLSHAGRRLRVQIRVLLLVLVTLFFHMRSGFLWGGRKQFEVYQHVNVGGLLALDAARHLPCDGVLLTENTYSGICANRADLLTWRRYNPAKHKIDHVFTWRGMVGNVLKRPPFESFPDGDFGVLYYDGEFIILSRTASTAGNQAFLDKLNLGPMALMLTPFHRGENRHLRDGSWVRYWEGNGYQAPVVISYGATRELPSGTYDALFRYRVEEPEKHIRNDWGWFSVHGNGEAAEIARLNIPQTPTAEGVFEEARVRFTIDVPTAVEVRVTGGDAPLWVRDAVFEPVKRVTP